MDIYEEIIHKYRSELVKFCLARMKRGEAAAEDVAQEVFLTLYTKKSLDLHGNIRAWLFRTAEKKIKEYNRRNPIFEELTEISVQTDPIQDSELPDVLEILTEEERQLTKEYYLNGEEKKDIASRHDRKSTSHNYTGFYTGKTQQFRKRIAEKNHSRKIQGKEKICRIR